MRILIVSQYFWPESFCINELSASLVKRGHVVEVLTGKPNYPSGKYFDGYGFLKKRNDEYRGVKIHRVPLLPRGNGGNCRLILNYLSFVFFSCFLGPLRCRSRYDLVFVYEPSPITVCLPALLLKWLRKIPVVFWIQDLWPESISATKAISSSFILRKVDCLVKYIYERCDCILVQSMAFFEPIMRMGIREEKIKYYPNSADPLYNPIQLESEAGERKQMPEGFRVMFAGNIGVAQDFGTILNAAELLRYNEDIRWVIIGDGRQFNWVKAEIQKRRLKQAVCLLGRRPPETMPRYLALADVLLVTLRKEPIFALTIPAKIQAYLACGKPILAGIDGEGARVVNEAGVGLTCPAEQPELLASRVLEFYRMDVRRRQEMGANGRAYCEQHFNASKLIERLEEIMQGISSHRGSTPAHGRSASIGASRQMANAGEKE